MVAQPWKHVALQPPDNRRGMAKGPSGRELLEPLPCYRFEAASFSVYQSSLSRFSLGARISVSRQDLTRLVTSFTGLSKPDFGIDAKGQELFLAPKAIFEPPKL